MLKRSGNLELDVMWLWSPLEIKPLAQHFRRFLNCELPRGEIAIFRFYDPTVFINLIKFLTKDQIQKITNPISEWWGWDFEGIFYVQSNLHLVMEDLPEKPQAFPAIIKLSLEQTKNIAHGTQADALAAEMPDEMAASAPYRHKRKQVQSIQSWGEGGVP
jgi:hypothetical protein